MANKNQILVFIVSFLIAGSFLLSIPEPGFSGVNGPGCCEVTEPPFLCFNVESQFDCEGDEKEFFPGLTCNEPTGECEPLPNPGCCDELENGCQYTAPH